MIPGSLARRYARALLGLASQQRLEDKVLTEIGSFAETFHDSKDLKQTLTTPMVPAEVRRRVLDEVLGRLAASDLTRKFLFYIEAKGRMVGIEDIHRSFKRMVDEKLGRVDAEVTTAGPLEPAEAARLKKHLEGITGKQVVLTQVVDRSIVGGAITRIGHVVYDGSIRSFLEEARRSLMSESA